MDNITRDIAQTNSLSARLAAGDAPPSALLGATPWEDAAITHLRRLDSASNGIEDGVAVLQSAVLLHGGKLWRTTEQAHLWMPWSHHGSRGAHQPPRTALSRKQRRLRLSGRSVVCHRMQIDEGDLVLVDDVLATGLAQTILHCARFLPPDDAKVAVESLIPLAIGRDPRWRECRADVQSQWMALRRELLEALRPCAHQRGVRQAREMLGTASPFSESPYESAFHRIALAAGYSALEPQMKVSTRSGDRWTDFGCRRARIGIDISGDVKYEGDAGAQYRLHQHSRDQDIRDTGVDLVNLTSHDVHDTSLVLELLDRYLGETRDRHGLRSLWTRWEEPLYGF